MLMSSYEKCGYYSDGECSICGMGMSGEDTFCRLCKDNPSCYYKQLLELKAENDRLHERILKLTEENGSLIVQNNTLKENFDGQRNAYKKLNSMYEENCEYTGKLEQTLQEIKAIAEECTTCGDCSNCKYCEDCDTDLECQALGVCKMILDIITKAEEE